MTDFTWSQRSRNALQGIHPKLRVLADRALSLSVVDFMVTCGLRTLDEQAELVRLGASRTMDSKHLHGLAIDVAPIINGRVRWDWPLFHQINCAFLLASDQTNIPYRWGGDWKYFPDGPHFELTIDKSTNSVRGFASVLRAQAEKGQ